MTLKIVHVFGGGTISHVRPHLALCAPAFGSAARWIHQYVNERHMLGGFRSYLHLTRMADPYSPLETNEDVAQRLTDAMNTEGSRIIILNTAFCDFDGAVLDTKPSLAPTTSGKSQQRLRTSDGNHLLRLTPTEKILSRVRRDRKDLFLVAFKTTAGASPDEQFSAGLSLLKKNSANLVLANDVHTRLNMVITPEQARYHETTDRTAALTGLVDMAILRSKGTFTRSTVIPGESVGWDSDMVPESLRTVVNHCIARGAYRPFNGATVGHFAYKVDDHTFVTSKRKVDFNQLADVGMVLCSSSSADRVLAQGHKPSVGGQSQRIIFREHPGMDCIVHAHVQRKPNSKVPVRSQRPYECGSHQCGKNTSDGLLDTGTGIKAVMLDKHGPNIVFNRNTDPQSVINFIEENFDLTRQTSEIPGEM